SKILIGIPSNADSSVVDKAKDIVGEYAGAVELTVLKSADEKENLEELKQIAAQNNIEFVARLDLKGVKDIETVINAFIKQIDRDRFSLVYAELAGLTKENIAEKNVSELRDLFSIVVGDFLKLRAESIDERIATGEYWQLRGLLCDNTILGMSGLLAEMKEVKEPHAAVVSNVMLESDASVLAKIKAKRLHKGLNKVKDVLTIFNPKVTEQNVKEYLKDLGAESVFDEVVLYKELKSKEGRLDQTNIVRVVKGVVKERLDLDAEHVILVGGEAYFEKIASVVVAILTGDIDKYLDELVNFLNKYGSAYEDALIGIYTKDEALLAKLKERRTLKEESDSYKQYIEDYRRFIKEVITKL
ncbi:MAG: hypothetical protein ABIH42_02975, partial [Planctomycetota bacterium]